MTAGRGIRWDGRAGAILIFALTGVVYANSLFNGFVWDDFPVLVQNPAVRTLANLPSIFSDPKTAAYSPSLHYYRPLRTLVLSALYQAAGPSPFWFHLLNLAVHLGNVALVLLLLRELGARRPVAMAMAAVFGVHPITTEAVANVSGLSELMFAFFYLAGMVLHIRRLAVRENRGPLAAGVFACLALSLLSKEMAVTFPGVILLHYWLAGRQMNRRIGSISREAGYVAGLAALTAGYLALRTFLIGGLSAGEYPGVTFARTMAMQAQVMGTYLRLIFLPVEQTARYVVPVLESFPSLSVLVSILVILLVLATAVFASRRQPLVTFGIGWFFLTLIPVMNFIPLRGSMMGERFLYLPLAGVLIAISAVAGRILEPFTDARRNRWGQAACAVALCLLSLATVRRNMDWRSNLTLFESAVRVSPRSNAVRIMLSREYEKAGRRWEAREQLRAGGRNTLFYFGQYVRMGERAEARGRGGEALAWYRRALRMNPAAKDIAGRVGRLRAASRR